VTDFHHASTKSTPIEHFVGSLLQHLFRQRSGPRSEIKNAAVKRHDELINLV
jgi:hypothetical protein